MTSIERSFRVELSFFNPERRKAVVSLVLGAALGAFWVQGANAQAGTDAATARALFREARTLADGGRYEAACPKFEESLRLRPGDGTRFNLADCWDHLGRTASAWGQFLEVAAAAKNGGQKDREQLARKRAAALEAKLSYLIIEVNPAVEGLVVKRDDQELREGAFGTKVPIDPGAHTVSATAPGKRQWSTEVQVSGTEPIRVKVPALESDSTTSTAAPTGSVNSTAPENGSSRSGGSAGAPRSSRVEPQLETTSSEGFGTQRTLAVVAGGLGVVGLALGTGFYLDFSSKNHDAKQVCPNGVDCSPSEIARHDDLVTGARQSRTLGIVGFAAGGAALATGVVLYFTGSPRSQSEQAVNLAPLVGPTLMGVSAGGVF